MSSAKDPRAIEQEIETVYRLYAGLARFMRPETGLGGSLLYGGEPDEDGTPLLRAANIGGAASLAAAADPGLLHRAMREGAIDFVVSSLDEALRILKNEIRKKQPVAVGVSVGPESLPDAMKERGVQPDLLAPSLPSHPAIAEFRARGAQTVEPQTPAPDSSVQVLAIPAEWKLPLSALDALFLESLAPGDEVNRRWVRLAPRYLGSRARRFRAIACAADTASDLRRRIQAALENQPGF